MEKAKYFEQELVYIQNPKIKEFAVKAIESLPDYFFHVAASSSGRYHPQYALGEGGLLRHTRAAVRIAVELSRIEGYALTGDELDLIIASLLVHDGWKHGLNFAQFTVTEHPVVAKMALENNDNLKNILPEEQLNTILGCISAHMGGWNRNKSGQEIMPKPSNKLEKLTHLADYLASRKCLIMDFDVPLSVS